MTTHRVMIVDDSSLVREILTTLVKEDPNLEVCAEAENGREAIVKCAEHDPDLILLDLQMPEFDGLSFFKALSHKDSS